MTAKALLPMVPTDLVTSLFILTMDPDEEVSQTARNGLLGLPSKTIFTAIEGGLDTSIVEAVTQLRSDVTTMKVAEPTVVEPAPHHTKVSREEIHFTPDLTVDKTGEFTEVERASIYRKIQGMTVSEKIKLALLGNKGAREVLLKDSNKLVASTVLKNPRITEDEIAKIVNSRNVSDEVLREVANNKEWLKKYPIRLGLVNNPRTPLGISLRQLSYLQDRDIKHLAKSKNIPSVLAAAAKKVVMQRERH